MSSVFAISGIASPAGIDSGTGPVGSPYVVSSVACDAGTGPVGVVGVPNPVAPGYATSVQVTLGSASSTATVVSLSSSTGYLAVPTSITIPAGSTVGYATAYASISAPPTNAVVTASSGGVNANGTVVIQ